MILFVPLPGRAYTLLSLVCGVMLFFLSVGQVLAQGPLSQSKLGARPVPQPLGSTPPATFQALTEPLKAQSKSVAPPRQIVSGTISTKAKVIAGVPDLKDSKLITGLTFPAEIDVRNTAQGGGAELQAVLIGNFDHKDWNLIYRTKKVPLSADPTKPGFKLVFPMQSKQLMIKFSAVGPKGEVEKQNILIVYESFDLLKARTLIGKKWTFSAGLGVTSFNYQQSPAYSITGLGLTPKLSVGYILSPKFDIALNGFMTAIDLKSTPATTTIRFIGSNLRAGYRLPWIANPWKLSIAFGFYYSMATTNTTLGYSGVGGLQLFPTLSRALANGDTVLGYFKFSPVGNSLGFLSLASREIASGLSWIHPLKNSHPLSVSFDYADLAISFAPVSTASAKTMTLGMGYGLL